MLGALSADRVNYRLYRLYHCDHFANVLYRHPSKPELIPVNA